MFFMVESLCILESRVVGARKLQAHSAPLQRAPGTQRWARPQGPSHCQVCALAQAPGKMGWPSSKPWASLRDGPTQHTLGGASTLVRELSGTRVRFEPQNTQPRPRKSLVFSFLRNQRPRAKVACPQGSTQEVSKGKPRSLQIRHLPPEQVRRGACCSVFSPQAPPVRASEQQKG